MVRTRDQACWIPQAPINLADQQRFALAFVSLPSDFDSLLVPSSLPPPRGRKQTHLRRTSQNRSPFPLLPLHRLLADLLVPREGMLPSDLHILGSHMPSRHHPLLPSVPCPLPLPLTPCPMLSPHSRCIQQPRTNQMRGLQYWISYGGPSTAQTNSDDAQRNPLHLTLTMNASLCLLLPLARTRSPFKAIMYPITTNTTSVTVAAEPILSQSRKFCKDTCNLTTMTPCDLIAFGTVSFRCNVQIPQDERKAHT